MICKFNTIPTKILTDFFLEIDRPTLKFFWKWKRPRVAILEKKNKAEAEYYLITRLFKW